MIPVDQLTRAERLRLECFNQAINSAFTMQTREKPTIEQLFEHAKKIEEFLKSANPN